MSEREPERLFSLDEAKAAVRELGPVLERIRGAREVVVAHARPLRRKAPTDGGGSEGGEYWRALHDLREGVEEVAGRGIVLRDAETGLVDFPARREGRVVYYCWRLGEPDIGFWHEVDAGFGSRKPI